MHRFKNLPRCEAMEESKPATKVQLSEGIASLSWVPVFQLGPGATQCQLPVSIDISKHLWLKKTLSEIAATLDCKSIINTFNDLEFR